MLLTGGKLSAIASVAVWSARRIGAAAGFDSEAFNFLVECGKRDLEAFGGFCLIPIGALEHVDDDSALHFLEDFEERGSRSGATRADFARQRRQKLGKLQANAFQFRGCERFRGVDRRRRTPAWKARR